MKPMKANRMPIKSICAYCGECACTKSSCKDIKKEEDDFVEWQRLKYAKELAAMAEYKREQEWLHDQIDRCSQTEEETAEGEVFFDNIMNVQKIVIELYLFGE